ncbi:MAG: ADP-ribosylglycohydrolase family protein [Lachnospiraceae bacterium]|nr:ADP-ribosylglycohydrolase family protein [Lachnospiraceae bacterium]
MTGNETEYRAEKKRCENAVRGCMVGGGAGDALGYPVEFWSENEIRRAYGEAGIISYQCSPEEGLAVVSDDTQMTMFTATGILYGYTRGWMRGIMGPVSGYVYEHYLDWLHTQEPEMEGAGMSWLREIPSLHVRRAPGMTCLSALRSAHRNRRWGTCQDPLNHSKGCGGIMRVAPVALHVCDYHESGLSLEELKKLDRDGAEVAAITHGHPLGYIPAAALVHILNRIVYGGCTMGDSLYDITAECRMTMEQLFEGEPYLKAFLRKLDAAVTLSKNSASDSENIRQLGEGWVAEETFAIALYCSLRYPDDFSKAITASVNHSGDSDSTGAVTGNIAGALVGYEGIDEKWKRQLEFHKLLLELADDLCYGCPMSEYSEDVDENWVNKYMMGRRTAGR